MIRKVVIIDDEPWTRDVILRLGKWTELGLEVVGEASDGETGLALVQRVCPDVVITDIKMPGIDGIELVERLRKKGYQNPILVISGYGDYPYVRSALKLGVVDYLLKPIKAQELNQQLKRCVNSLSQAKIFDPTATTEVCFFADGWESSYFEVRSTIETALRIGNQLLIHQQLEKLETLLCQNEGETPPITIMIGIYYALLFSLQRYVGTMGIDRNAAFSNMSATFVFNRDTTIRQIMNHIEAMYCAVIDYLKKQQHMRLDVEAVRKFIDENYAQGINLEQTADTFHVTKEYMSKAFKQSQGMGFTEYVTSLRMRRAYDLITSQQVQLKEVGSMVGYFDLAHFYKTFKKFFGKTPGEVRDSLKKDNEQ